MAIGDDDVRRLKAEEARYHREQTDWLERHTKNADLLECNTKTGICERAVYFSPLKKLQDFRDEHFRQFCVAVNKEMARRGELEE
jgi:hypothetical protein